MWDHLAVLATSDLGEVGAGSEPDPVLRQHLPPRHGGVRTHETHGALLERADLDGVRVFADNPGSAELGIRALRRGLRVMVTDDLASAEALLAAGRDAGLPAGASVRKRPSRR